MKVKTEPVVAHLKITHCEQCPFLDKQREYTEDSWELAFNWYCKKKDNKEIAGYVGWNEENNVKIPKWCPLIK